MEGVHIDTTQAGKGALTALWAGELCRYGRLAVLVMAVMAGLLGMHVLGGHAMHSMAVPPAQMAPHTLTQTANSHAGAPESDADECGPGQPAAPAGASAHCTPAPGAVAPVPPAVVDLARSDALPRPPVAAAHGPVRARAPAPDLAQLSISRT